MGKQWKTAGKEAQASKKGALFTGLSREIQVAVRLAGPSPKSNPRLKLALETARAHSLPKATIKRAMEKGVGTKEGEHIEEVIYEGFGPHGTAFLLLCLTDNRARTVSEIRYLFKKNKGHLGEKNSVMWMFDKVSLVQAFCEEGQARAEEDAIETGAEDLAQAEEGAFDKATAPAEGEGSFAGRSATIAGRSATIAGRSATIAGRSATIAGRSATIAGRSATIAGRSATIAGRSATIAGRSATFLFYGKTEDLHSMKEGLVQRGWTVLKAGWIYRAKDKIKLNTEQKNQALALWRALSEHPDCQSVHTNIH